MADNSAMLCRLFDDLLNLFCMTDEGTRTTSMSSSNWLMVALATLSAVSPKESETTYTSGILDKRMTSFGIDWK